MAHDLAARLLPVFENTTTGIPYPRVRVQTNYTCTPMIDVGIINTVNNTAHCQPKSLAHSASTDWSVNINKVQAVVVPFM